MTAVITNGWKWADDKPCEKGSVLFFYGEEGIADTYKKRFRANGANDENVVFIKGKEWIDEKGQRSEIDLTLIDIAIIERAIVETAKIIGLPVKMVVVDPISNYWGGKKENSNEDVRSVLKPLQHLAERTGVAFVMIQHTGKGDVKYAQQRILGSTGIVATCRSVWGVFVDPDDKGKRLFAPVKVNCGYGHTTVSYKIVPPDGRVDIIENNIENMTGDDIENRQRQVNQQQGQSQSKKSKAIAWLREYLADGGKPVKEIEAAAKANDISFRTLERAKDKLEIKINRVGFGKDSYNVWELPPIQQPTVHQNTENDESPEKQAHEQNESPHSPPNNVDTEVGGVCCDAEKQST